MNTIELKKRLAKSIEFLKSELTKIRTGRASPSMLDDVRVKAYEQIMTVKELASISVLDPKNILVSPWDKKLASDIAKGIRDSDLNLNPIVDGDLIRVPVPELSQERRQELSKVVASKVEETKQAVRNIRQEAMKDIEKDFEDKKISEDDKFRFKEDVNEIVKESNEQAEEIGEKKVESIRQI